MNFTPELSAFQGAILSADNVHQFSRLTAKGGNEDSIDFVTESILSFLEQSQYIINNKVSRSAASQVRKFALYIVLNADLPELQQLLELEDISTLIWTTPTIPKCLMCELMWNLHMEKFILEIISYANPQLALEVAGAFLEHFKYFNPLECLDQLQLLSTASYTLICRLHLFNFEPTDLETKSTAAFNNFQKCLKYYTTPPNNYKLNALSKSELYKYQGQSLYSLLQLLEECLTQFAGKLEANPPRSEDYTLTYLEDSLKKDGFDINVCDSTNSVLLECLNNANIAVLDICKVLVMDVSIDVFCCWSEFEDKGKTMQQTVGELSFKIQNKLLNMPSLVDHSLVNMLEQISRKPVEMKEKINATEDKDIILKINVNTEESVSWVKALIYKEKLCQNTELLNIVNTNIDVYDQNECYELYTVLKQNNNLELDNKDFVEMMAVTVFDKCELSKKYDILENHFVNKMFVNMKETSQFTNAMTSVFNKLIALPDEDLTEILTLFLQNPQKVLMKIFSLASENSHQTQIMLRVMKLLDKFSDHYYNTEAESCVIQITQKMFETLETEPQENNFIQFICGLKNNNVIPGTKLLLLVIMTNLHQALLNNDIRRLYVQLKVLKEAYKLHEMAEYRTPMLAMLGQVLDVVRWQIDTFTANAPGALNLALHIQTKLIDTYNGVIPENDSQWLKSKLKKMKPMNMYYYRVLWNPPGSNYIEIVSRMKIKHPLNIHMMASWLAQVICSCTQQEWCEIWDSLTICDNTKILNIFQTGLSLVTYSESVHRTENSSACIFHAYRNYVYIMRYKFITEPITDDQVQSIVSKAGFLASDVPEKNVEELGALLMPIFAYLMEKQIHYNIDLIDCLNDYLGRTKLSTIIKKMYADGSN